MTGWWQPTAAVQRLTWLLDGLAGRWPDNVDVDAILAPAFAAQVPPLRFGTVTHERSAALAPILVTGVDVDGDTATARFRARDGGVWVARVTVDPVAPHRIVHSYVQPWVPGHLTPALPQRFTDEIPSRDGGAGSKLVVFGGVPGSGKSAVAEGVGAAWGVPVFSLDWLLGALTPFGLYHRPGLSGVGDELLTTLAYRELSAGRSAIVDTTSEDTGSRSRWESLTAATGAAFLAVVCVCPDPVLHRERVERRERRIPGWHDAGDWTDVSTRRKAFLPWPGALTVDTTEPLAACVELVTGRASAA